MSTNALRAPGFIRPGKTSPAGGLLRRLGQSLFAIVLLLAAVPVFLLFWVTSVPLIIALILLLLDVGLVTAWLRTERTPLVTAGTAVAVITVSALAVIASQRFAATPPITTPGSIATMEQVELNGSQQWITIRGRSIHNPVLLFLAGGPGGSELVMTRKYLDDLEDHFVVVNWDQPGTGKSYNAAPLETLTPQRYIEDAHALSQYLRERFHQQKIYVFGESWGSILGVWLVQQHPELYHAFISTGQMVDPVENDIMMYEFALGLLNEQGRAADAENLRRNGPPPYAGHELISKFGAMNDVINSYMHAHARGEGTNHNLLIDSLRAQEYGLLDKVSWVQGLLNTFPTVYPQVYDVDFRTQATRLQVPVYFVVGRWDVNAMASLAEEYFNILEAPHKELIWFEDSAHTPMWDEPTHFVDVMVNTVLAQTQPPVTETEAVSFPHYFDQQIPAYLREYGIAGATVAVVQDGQPIHLAGYGFANLENHVPMDAERSVVHIGSAGKTFTAIAIMQLVEQGLVDLDADVTTYIDFDIPATYPDPITIRHLLTHTAGFEAHDLSAIVLTPDALPTTHDYLIRNLPQRVRPAGAEIGYSNYGLALLGYVVEQVSGRTLSDYLQVEILAPLNMTHSSAQVLPAEPMATGYARMQAQPVEYIAAFGAGPVRTTAADMASYMIANLQSGQFGDAQILQPETARSMQAQQFSAAPHVNGIGFGFYEMSCNGQRIVGHLGTTFSFHSLLLLLPDQQLGIFVSFNSAEGGQVLRSGRFLDDLMHHFFPDTFAAVPPPTDFAQRASDYAGTYFWNNRFGQTTIEKLALLPEAVTIRPTADNRLSMLTGGIGRTFTETEPDTFVRSDGQDTLVFHRDESGQVTDASLSSRAVFTLERRPWYESPVVTLAALVGTGVIFILSLAMSGYALWHTRGQAVSALEAVGQWSAVLIPLLNLAFLASLFLLLPAALTGALPETTLRLVLLLPMIAAALTVILIGFTLTRWLQTDGTLLLRVQYTVLAAAGLIFVVVLYVWNLLGWRI